MGGQDAHHEPQLSSEKQTLLALRRLKAKVEALERARSEPIACVGIGCRFPGADGPSEYWDLLVQGRSAVREVPSDRWNVDDYYDPDPDAPGKMSTRWGGFLERVDLFDAKFFGITPREAAGMDPQQRLLLEVAWEALEHAGESPAALSGTTAGVFVGISTSDYLQLHLASQSIGDIDAYFGSGTSHSVASGRLSYFLGIRGPSVSVDTACSSSLVAVHLACQSLRSDECRLALAAGVNLILTPEGTINLSKAHMMAADGHCKTFDANADGFVRGEGCGVIVLKRLSHAIEDGNRILALIRATAINQDGRSNGLTAPNEIAQEEVIRETLLRAGLGADQIDYVEAHGTGTALGDPIEVQALAAAMRSRSRDAPPVYLGSVKTNIGHLEATAGIASLIKVVLSLEHAIIPAHLNLKRRSPFIPWDSLPLRFEIPSRSCAWSKSGPRIASVSSFGFSGTNSHAILEQAPLRPARAPHSGSALLPVSATDVTALRQLTRRYEEMTRVQSADWHDVCFTAAVGRSHFEHRIAVIADSMEEARPLLGELEQSGVGSTAGAGKRPAGGQPKVAFLFTGQGSQYGGMGQELYRSWPLCRKILDRCDEILRPELDASLLAVMFDAQGTQLTETRFAQPALFAIEYALAMLWRSLGVRPSFGLGHSVGEYSAATVAGVLELEDALRLVARRGRLMQSLPAGGAMAAALCDERAVRAAMKGLDSLVVAAINGPQNVVVAGPTAEVDTFVARLSGLEIRVERLAVSHAFHSPLVEPILDELEAAANVTHRAPEFGVISNLSGTLIKERGVYEPAYWRRHARDPVDFYAGMRALADAGCDAFVEVGPHPVLLGMGRQCVSALSQAWLPSLRRGRNDQRQFLESLGELYVRGANIRWTEAYSRAEHRRVSLPTYPFQRESFWLKTAPRRSVAPATAPHTADLGTLKYELVWQLAPRAAEDSRAGAMPTALAELIDRQWSERARECGLPVYDSLLPELNALCTQFVLAAFEPLEPLLKRAKPCSSEELAVALEVHTEQRSAFNRLLEILCEDGYLERRGTAWAARRDLAVRSPEEHMRTCRERFPGSAELELLARCGPRLREVLQGRCSALSLLFPDGSAELAEALYQSSPFAVTYNSAIGDAIARLAASNTSTEPLRILEVGGGTGGTTTHALPKLAGTRVEYVFTDVSPLFLHRAAKKYATYPFVDYKVFDLERDPVEQDLPVASFDLIVAANVVHATKDLAASLRRLRALLRRNGTLILLEGNAPQRFGDLTVGLTEGWWRFEDRELRPDYPLLGRAAWRDLLRSTGFDHVAMAPGGVDASGITGVAAEHAIIFARASALEASTSAPGAPQWLIFTRDTAEGEGLAGLLRERGARCAVVPMNPSTIAPAGFDPSHEDFSRALSGVPATDFLEVLYLSNVQTADDADSNDSGGVIELVNLTRALVASGRLGSCRLRVLTRGADACVAGDYPDPRGAMLWGFGRVVALEHPDLWGGLIDCDPRGASVAEREAIAAELLQPTNEDQVALRGSDRYVPRITRMPLRAQTDFRLDAEATYLITGGLGDLGPKVARWMIAKGARSLVLTSRIALPERPSWSSESLDPQMRQRVATVLALERLGAAVEVAQCDAADQTAMSRLIDEIATRTPPLRGVIHAAGVSFLRPCIELDAQALMTAWAAKVGGALAIDRATRKLSLDFVVYFSSAAAIWGSAGLAHYAAGNRLLDAIAIAGRLDGRNTLSVNWARWGTAARELEVYFDRIGLRIMDETAALDAMGDLIAGGNANAIIAAVDWDRFKAVYSARRPRPLLNDVARTTPRRPTDEAVVRVGWRDELETILAHDRSAWLLERVRSEVARIIGLPSPERLDLDQGFFDLGMDSLMAVELKRKFEVATNATLATSLAFDYPTVRALARYLATEVFALESARPVVATPGADKDPASLLDMIERLSDDEVASLLDERDSRSSEAT
jgi:acyl transferase domain-containing protein/SAM-dependent methyltransferase/acyl carrier protein